MFSFLGRLFGSEKALEKSVEAISNGFDKLHYGDQEKAEDAAEARREAGNLMIEWFRSTQGQNLTRRFIAVSFTIMFLLLVISGISVGIGSIWVDDPVIIDKLNKTGDIIFKYIQEIGTIFMLIILFYFGGPYAGDMISKFTNKIGNTNGKTR